MESRQTLSQDGVLRWYPDGVRGFEGLPRTPIPRYVGNARRAWRIGETTDDTGARANAKSTRAGSDMSMRSRESPAPSSTSSETRGRPPFGRRGGIAKNGRFCHTLLSNPRGHVKIRHEWQSPFISTRTQLLSPCRSRQRRRNTGRHRKRSKRSGSSCIPIPDLRRWTRR